MSEFGGLWKHEETQHALKSGRIVCLLTVSVATMRKKKKVKPADERTSFFLQNKVGDTLPHAKTARIWFTEVECHSLELADISAHAILHNIFHKSLWNRVIRHCGVVFGSWWVMSNIAISAQDVLYYRPLQGDLHLEVISGIDDTTVNKKGEMSKVFQLDLIILVISWHGWTNKRWKFRHCTWWRVQYDLWGFGAGRKLEIFSFFALRVGNIVGFWVFTEVRDEQTQVAGHHWERISRRPGSFWQEKPVVKLRRTQHAQ